MMVRGVKLLIFSMVDISVVVIKATAVKTFHFCLYSYLRWEGNRCTNKNNLKMLTGFRVQHCNKTSHIYVYNVYTEI